MSIVLISESPLAGNAALFENDEVQGQDQGDITWGSVGGEEGAYNVTYSGTDVEGTSIASITIDVEIATADTTNPTKIFWAIVKAVGEILCPECNPGH